MIHTAEKLEEIFNTFKHNNLFDSIQELASGHINDTYLVKTKQKPFYVLQRINHKVFKDVPGLVKNKVAISLHLQKKLSHLKKEDQNRKVLKFVKNNSGNYYFKENNGCYWNLMIFIDNSITFDLVKNKEIAYQGGKLFGNFLNLTSDFDASKLTEVIPNFHTMSFRFTHFMSALQSATSKRIHKASSLIAKVRNLKEEMHIIENLKSSGELKTRVTHNDTKISNALFDANNKGLCVIDTDTVMPGVAHFDFGDAIRTICNTAAEDEKDLNKVNFNVEYYKAYTNGYLEEMGSSLSSLEIKLLPLAAKTMIFIIGLRFLTDFLNNDIYFKTAYLDHNLVRAKNQFKLIDSLVSQMDIPIN